MGVQVLRLRAPEFTSGQTQEPGLLGYLGFSGLDLGCRGLDFGLGGLESEDREA